MTSDPAARIQHLTAADFAALTLRHSGLWLVDFTSAYCPPCRQLEPVLAGLATTLAGQLAIGRVDVEEQGELVTRFGVVSMPTMLLFSGGAVVGQKVGAMPRHKILAWLEASGVAARAVAAG